MPELPEVETVRRGLANLIVGRMVRSAFAIDSPKSFPNAPSDVQSFLVGAEITDIRRRAKVLLIDLSSGYTLVVHLKMTGQLVFVGKNVEDRKWKIANGNLLNSKSQSLRAKDEVRFGAGHPNDSLIGELPDRSTRVVIEFTDATNLYFNDQRKFGWMKLYPTIEVPEIDFMKRVGPEPLTDEFTSDILYQRLQRRKGTTIKAALLDQSVLAGIGNIYADEALWGARIHPATRVRDLPPTIYQLLTTEIKYVLELAIEKGGSTDKNYVNAEGKRGSYIDFARVFRREGLACPRHPDVIIQKIRVAGRGTHICGVCQVQ